MHQKINLLLSDLNEQLNFINLEIDNPIKKCEKAIEICVKAFDNLKKLMLKLGFKSTDEEIIFFERN